MEGCCCYRDGHNHFRPLEPALCRALGSFSAHLCQSFRRLQGSETVVAKLRESEVVGEMATTILDPWGFAGFQHGAPLASIGTRIYGLRFTTCSLAALSPSSQHWKRLWGSKMVLAISWKGVVVAAEMATTILDPRSPPFAMPWVPSQPTSGNLFEGCRGLKWLWPPRGRVRLPARWPQQFQTPGALQDSSAGPLARLGTDICRL